MDMYNNDARKKQKKTVAVDNTADSSLTIPAVVVPCSALSFGNILKEFPDFLLCCVLPYISDRVIWNSIASSNKDIHTKSKAIRPPWPLYYKLPPHKCVSWSPCGTHIACRHDYSNIVIIDQRLGPLRYNGHINAHDGCHINILKYSPNGRFLISAGYDGFVKLWDNVTGNYELLQEWNMREEVAEEVSDYLSPNFSISTCSKYIAVSLGKWAYLKDVQGKTIKSLLPFAPNENRIHINNIVFSSGDHAVFICCQQHKNELVKVWRPYLDDDNEDRLITLWRDSNHGAKTFEFPHDNTMVAIHNKWTNTGMLFSIDNDHKCLTKKFDVQGSTGFHFTPDGKYIVVNKENGRPILWSIAEGTYTNETIYFVDNGSITKHNNLVLKSLSPNNRQCIVRNPGTGNPYITSYFYEIMKQREEKDMAFDYYNHNDEIPL